MQPVETFHSAPRAARQSEWLRSTLAHHHCPDPGVENEIVVLATGMDQYLQEVFHHLAYSNSDDVVSAEDFTVLCAVLGLSRAGEGRKSRDVEEEVEESHDVCLGLPGELSFKDFHSRLCEYFRVRALQNATGAGPVRLPVTAETEHVERQIRIRWPRARRRKCVSFDLTRDQTGRRPVHASKGKRCGKENDMTDLLQQCESEAAALRELVEDLRSALQGSDARCLALEVALRRERGHQALRNQGKSLSNTLSPSNSNMATSSRVATPGGDVGTLNSQGRGHGVGGEVTLSKRTSERPEPMNLLLRELKMIRSSRDGQLEEAIRFNQQLEEELSWAYQEARRLQGVESRLRKDNAEIRRRAEEAREALRLGLQRVRLIQEQAQHVPALQSRVTQLETQLQEYRSGCTCRGDPTPQSLYLLEQDDTCIRTGVGLQRAVEGKAASDEEEEERREEEQCCLTEVKKLINRLHSTAKGCPNPAVHHLFLSHNLLHDNDLITSPWDGEGRGHKASSGAEERGNELDKRREQVAGLKVDVPMVETERVQLSLLEGKLTDALTLLLKLRKKNVSRRALGKILMDSLDMCSSNGHGPSQVLQLADAFCVQLSSSELLQEERGGGGEGGGEGRGEGGGEGGGGRGERSQQGSSGAANLLLISC